jgi:DNA-directed RNA polymerase subunit RPC12/RpoP
VSKEIDHTDTDEIVCPHCGYENDCSHEFYFDANHRSDKIECWKCKQVYSAEREFYVIYSSEKLDPKA